MLDVSLSVWHYILVPKMVEAQTTLYFRVKIIKIDNELGNCAVKKFPLKLNYSINIFVRKNQAMIRSILRFYDLIYFSELIDSPAIVIAQERSLEYDAWNRTLFDSKVEESNTRYAEECNSFHLAIITISLMNKLLLMNYN